MAGAEEAPRRAPGVISLLLRRFTWRHWCRQWKSTLLLVGILALGVGVFLSIRLANRAAVSGFGLFTQSISGESDYVVRPRSGSSLSVAALAETRDALGDLPVAMFPIIEATVAEATDDPSQAPIRQVVGADLVALRNAVLFGAGESPLGASANEGNEDSGFHLGSRDQAFFAARDREVSGLEEGDRLGLVINDEVVEIEVVGWLEDDPLRPAVPRNLVLMDLPGAQRLLGWEDRISRIELVVPPGEGVARIRAELKERLQSAFAGTNRVLEGQDDRERSVGKMTHAFRMNLTVLSTLALLVGTYLILQALEAAVVRRRGEIAVLRSLGVDQATIRRLWFAESLLLGVVGSGLGILVGWGGAQLTVGAIAQTVNGLYYSTTTEAAALHGGEAAAAFGFGIVASVVAGWLPARDAASTPPAQALRSGNRADGFRVLQRPRWGGLAAVLAVILGMLPPWGREDGSQIPLGGYLAALAWLVSLSILSGALFPLVRGAFKKWFSRQPEVNYAASQFRRPQGRHRLAVAGLVAAIGMASGMGVLVHSFEGTLTGWIGQLLRADLYVATAGANQADNANVIRFETWQALKEDEATEAVEVIRRYPIDYQGVGVQLAGTEYRQDSDRRLTMRWLEAPEDPGPLSLIEELKGSAYPAWINEAFSRRFEATRGSRIALPTPDGEKSILVEGVYSDYSDEAGTVLVSRQHTAAWFRDDSISNVAVYLKPGEDFDQVQNRWSERFPGLLIRQNARLRAEVLRVFHQTFAVTYALEAIGVFVAVAGLGLALASLMMERREELVTLKSIGFTRRQIARASAVEGAALGAVGFVGGMVLSLILGALLIFVINRQSFGWTLEYRVPWALLAGLGFLTLTTSAVVSAAVGFRGARLRSDQHE